MGIDWSQMRPSASGRLLRIALLSLMEAEMPKGRTGWHESSYRDAEPNNREITKWTFYGPLEQKVHNTGLVTWYEVELCIVVGFNRTWRIECAAPAGRRTKPFERKQETHGLGIAEVRGEAELLMRQLGLTA